MGILEKIMGMNTLYYPGCLTKFVMKNLQDNYEKILRKSRIDFIKLKDFEVCCGSPVHNAGYRGDFETLARKNLEIFKKHSVKKIITSCPACYKTFKQDYKDFLGEDWDIEVEHATQTILKALESGKLKIKKPVKKEKITYHDPCHLGRYSGIYEEPRKIMKKLGYEIVEMENNREDASCCGGGGGVKSNYPELTQSITKDVLKDAEKTQCIVLTTTCPMCDACFLKASEDSKMNVRELSELIVEGLG
jgi:Fe-S oxidoreductase